MIPRNELQAIVANALTEDVGGGDVTSRLVIPPQTRARLDFVSRETFVTAGIFVAEEVFAQVDRDIIIKIQAHEGELAEKGRILATATGPARAILTGERVALNLMQRMCGVATITRAYADAVRGTKAIILDTRKTMPGLRALDKYAVRAGGGQNHRMRLDDMILIKDNHIALCGSILAAVEMARKGENTLKIEVECDTLAQVKEALEAKPDRIMLDNMGVDMLCEAVALAGGRIPLEASGGVTLETVRGIAETGVDFISVGAITHSARSVDIGADVVFE